MSGITGNVLRKENYLRLRISRVLFDFRFGYVATATRPQLKPKNSSEICDLSVSLYYGTDSKIRGCAKKIGQNCLAF